MGLGAPRCLKRSASHSVAHCFPSLPPAEGSGGQWAKLREGVPKKVGAHRGVTSPAGTRRAISGCWPQASGDGRQMASCTQRWGSSSLKSENQVTESCLPVQPRAPGMGTGCRELLGAHPHFPHLRRVCLGTKGHIHSFILTKHPGLGRQ